jgi:predicted transcriptional regulator of viral defense system
MEPTAGFEPGTCCEAAVPRGDLPSVSLDQSPIFRYFSQVKSARSATDLVRNLASQGRYHFTTDEAGEALGSSLVATRAALRRLKQKGDLATPYRGFHVIVPPEYRRLGCLPGEQFIPQLMGHLGLAYHAALLSAAQYHGAAHQRPQVFQVMIQKNRPAIACGEVRVTFVARRNVDDIPVTERNTPRGSVRVSTPEATAFDLVGYPRQAGGLDHVLTVLTELAEALSAERLVALAPLSPVAWSQRLGSLLDRIGQADRVDGLAQYVRQTARETVLLDPRTRSAGERDPRWKLLVNACPVSDL